MVVDGYVLQEAYTRVLMGVIDLATVIWPTGVYGNTSMSLLIL